MVAIEIPVDPTEPVISFISAPTLITEVALLSHLRKCTSRCWDVASQHLLPVESLR